MIWLNLDARIHAFFNHKIMDMSLKYRPDIDGLRAIAVLLVVFYHANFPISGGFIGVDVFFVISGFLITLIIDKEIRENNFSYAKFYFRRIKRLVPALFFMIALVSVYCSYYLLPDDLISFSKTSILSLLGVSNFYFYLHTNYFQSTAFEPLLHTWSLAVEEQYYILWPAMIALIYKSKKNNVKNSIFIIIFLASVLLSWYYVYQDKNMAYMMLPFRFFELMSGAIVAINYRTLSNSKFNSSASKVVGIILIMTSALTLNDNSFFPGILAIPVVIGTCLVMLPSNGIVSHLLSKNIFVYIGKISYSLYLWHWPIITLAKYRGIELTTGNAIILIALSIVAAIVSYHLIENPFRKIKSLKLTFAAMYGLPILFVVSFWQFILINDGFRYRVEGLISELDESNTAHVIRQNCMEKMRVGNYKECHLGILKDDIDGVLIGDSFGNAYTGFIDVLAKDAGIMINDTARSSTPSIPNVFVSSIIKPVSDETANSIIDYNNRRTDFAKKQKIVIISDFWGQYTEENPEYRVFNKDRVDISKSSFELRSKYINSLVENGVKVYIIARPFSGIGEVEMAKLRDKKLHHANLESIQYGYGVPVDDRIEYRLKKEIPAITIIDPNKILCHDNVCHASISGDLLYRKDGLHINYSSSEKLGLAYLKEFGNPFK